MASPSLQNVTFNAISFPVGYDAQNNILCVWQGISLLEVSEIQSLSEPLVAVRNLFSLVEGVPVLKLFKNSYWEEREVVRHIGGRIEVRVGYVVSEGDPPPSHCGRGSAVPLSPQNLTCSISKRHIFVDC